MGDTSGAPISIPLPAERWLYWALFCNTQLLGVSLYITLTRASLESLRLVGYGLLWLNVSAWVVTNTARPPASRALKRRALAIAVGYFALLAFAGGLVGVGIGEAATGLRIAYLPPGYGPAVLYSGAWVTINLLPIYLVGYTALSYLLYVTVLDAAGSAAAGLLGLFSCVSCSWPILVSLASAVAGSGSILAASALQVSYGVSTAVFVVTAALLYWRPRLFALLPVDRS